tara:strand:- start:5278 stop:5655 length:378 start_codon:yes stop_codon:yes gene_type:complete
MAGQTPGSARAVSSAVSVESLIQTKCVAIVSTKRRKQMTKKDFELIAQTIERTDFQGQHSVKHTVVAELANVLARTNPRFDSHRFINACHGVTAPRLSKDILVNGTPEEFTSASLDDLDRMMEEV